MSSTLTAVRRLMYAKVHHPDLAPMLIAKGAK